MSETTELQVIVNDEPRSLPAGTCVADLVGSLRTGSAGVAVARNLSIVPRSEWSTTPLEQGDRLEVLTVVAGG